MKHIIIISILLIIPLLFFGQSDSVNIEELDIIDLEWNNDTGKINNEVVFILVEKMPNYVGGRTAMVNFIISNFQYPIGAYLNQVEGKVFVTFVVEKTGKLSNIKVLKGIGHGCDKEALKLIRLMPDWEAGMQRGKEVRVQYNLPITFRIDTEVKEDMEKAKAVYEKALKKYDNSELEKSLSLLNEALDLHPYYIEAIILRATVYKNLNDIDNACSDWMFAKELGDTKSERNIELNCKK